MTGTNTERKKNRSSWIVNVCFATLFFALTAWGQGLFSATNTVLIMRRLSDCFLIPAVVLGGIGALTWIAAKGNFDMLAFGTKIFINWIIHPTRKQESFYEYKMRQEEKNPSGKWAWRTLVVGMVCFVFSVIFAVIHGFIA